VFFFDEPDLYEVGHVADDGTAVDTALVSDCLIAGEALVGFAVAEREQGGVGCPDRTGKSGHVLVGDFFEANPVIFFVRAGFGFGGFAVAAGCAHGILTFPSTHTVCYAFKTNFSSVHTGRVFREPWSFLASKPIELQGTIFSARFSPFKAVYLPCFDRAHRKNSRR
jgi:hypothetical protein